EKVLTVERRDAALGHDPQQQGMNLGAGAVQLVKEKYGKLFSMFENRAGIDLRFANFIDIGVVDEVVRHQIDRALDTLISTTQSTRDGSQQGGLADTDIAFQHDVAAGEHCQSNLVNGMI